MFKVLLRVAAAVFVILSIAFAALIAYIVFSSDQPEANANKSIPASGKMMVEQKGTSLASPDSKHSMAGVLARPSKTNQVVDGGSAGDSDAFADIYAKQHGTCTVAGCAPGTRVAVLYKAGDDFFVCDKKEISIYTNTILGLIAMHYELTQSAPDISPITGEPVFDGETKDMLDSMRGNADVTTFGEAVKHCVEGRKLKGKRLLVKSVKRGSEYAKITNSGDLMGWISLYRIKKVSR